VRDNISIVGWFGAQRKTSPTTCACTDAQKHEIHEKLSKEFIIKISNSISMRECLSTLARKDIQNFWDFITQSYWSHALVVIVSMGATDSPSSSMSHQRKSITINAWRDWHDRVRYRSPGQFYRTVVCLVLSFLKEYKAIIKVARND